MMIKGFVPSTGPGTPYISRWSYGSPAHKHSLRATNWVVALNGTPTPTLDAFLEAAQGLAHGDTARLTCEALSGKQRMISLKLDKGYWPTGEVLRSPDGRWKAVEA